MKTRIIIEKDGERFVGVLPSDVFCKGDTVSEFIRKVEQIISRDETDKNNLKAENAKLREVMKDLVIVAKNRIPTIPTVFECEAICKANDIMKGEKK